MVLTAAFRVVLWPVPFMTCKTIVKFLKHNIAEAYGNGAHAPIQLKVHIISLVTMLAFYIWHWCTNCSNRQLTHKLLKLSITIHQAFSCCKTVQICHLNSTSENYIIPEISCVCTVPTKSHGTLARLPIESYSKQVCNLECCGNKMHQ